MVVATDWITNLNFYNVYIQRLRTNGFGVHLDAVGIAHFSYNLTRLQEMNTSQVPISLVR